MKINIQNLGAIKNAEINLSSKLTVFCGPNNSGKTYVSFLIYALTKSGLKFYRSNTENEFTKDLLDKGKSILKINTDKIWKYRKNEIENIKLSLDSIYGVSEDVANHLFNSFNIDIVESQSEFVNSVSEIFFLTKVDLNNISIEIQKKKGEDFIHLSLDTKIITKENIDTINLFLISKIYSLIAFYPFTSSYILPVERNSIYTFSKELSIQKQEFLERAQELGSKKIKDPFHWLLKKSTRYPMPIRDGLVIAEDLNNYSKTKSEFYNFAEEIETELLQGKVVVTKDGEVQFSSNKAKTKKIPIHLSASIVKTLSSLVFYLKYIALRNELIIIDEPELNLHPNNQVIITKVFAKLLNKGFRMLISTHSDYVVREINNLIMASSKNKGVEKIAEKHNYTNDLKLDPNDVKAYMFNYKKSNSRNITVSEIEVTEMGFDVSTIDNTVDVLNEVSEDLFYTIKYGLSNE